MKILAFDSWLGGIRHFQRLEDVLQKDNSKLILVHLSSWSGKDFIEIKSKYGVVYTKDISNYSNINFDVVLEMESPDVVLMLSTDVFAHRAMIRACKRKKIPVVHLYHGVMSVLNTENGSNYKINVVSRALFVSRRICKLFTKTLPSYFYSIIKDGLKYHDLQDFFRDSLLFISGKGITRASNDSKASLCLVYNESDKQHAMEKYNYKSDLVKVVGNPDLLEFGFSQKDLNIFDKSFVDNKYVVYLDTALYFRSAVYHSLDEYLYHLIQIKKQISPYNKKLVIKLHPEFNKTNFKSRLDKENIKVIEGDRFSSYLMKSCLAISEPTSVFLIPALMGLPIILPNFNLLKEQKFGKIMTSYPRSIIVKELVEIDDVLKSKLTNTVDMSVNAWINMNFGETPLEEMPKRVISYLVSLIKPHS
jgi:hypothetical protein